MSVLPTIRQFPTPQRVHPPRAQVFYSRTTIESRNKPHFGVSEERQIFRRSQLDCDSCGTVTVA